MRYRSLLLALVVTLGLVPGASAFADVSSGASTNVQEGDNDSDSDQSGEAASGDAVAGQVVGVVSSGDASVHATNRTESSDVATGDAEGSNDSASLVGLVDSGCQTGVSITADVCVADVATDLAGNVQEGDNAAEVVQAAVVSSGDGVTGQIVGVVASGTADLVLANTSIDADVSTGDAEFNNDAATAVILFQAGGPCCVLPTDTFGSAAESTIAIF